MYVHAHTCICTIGICLCIDFDTLERTPSTQAIKRYLLAPFFNINCNSNNNNNNNNIDQKVPFNKLTHIITDSDKYGNTMFTFLFIILCLVLYALFRIYMCKCLSYYTTTKWV